MTATPLWLFAEEKLPQELPLQPDPEAVQFNPALSLVDGVTDNDWPITTPARFGATETVIPDGAIVRATFTDLLCAGLPESVTEKVSEAALALAVGVPPIMPLVLFRDRPEGSDPLVKAQVYDGVPPVAVRGAL